MSATDAERQRRSQRASSSPGLELLQTLRGHRGWIGRLAWSPDGRRLASCGVDSTVRLWDVDTGEPLRTIEVGGGPVYEAAWSPDGRELATAGDDRTVATFDATTGEETGRFTGHAGPVRCVAWSPDGRTIASGARDGTVRIWEPSTGEPLLALPDHRISVRCAAWSPDGRSLATGGGDSALRLWFARHWSHRTLTGHVGYVFTAAWSPDGRLLASGASDCSVRLWGPATGHLARVLEVHTKRVVSLSFSGDGTMLASKGNDDLVLLWHVPTWGLVASLYEPSSDRAFGGLAFHPSRPLLATLGDREAVIRLWRTPDWLATPPEDAGDDPGAPSAPVASSAAPAVHYTTAKIVLVGDSGVGKTGLGWRLAHDEFREHPSTHGQQFWLLDQLRARRADGAECEAVLWDLAGQPDYRLIHALFLDDADLALVVFDPTDRQEPLHGVELWLEALSRRAGRPCRTILVAARTDRGDPTLTGDEIDSFCRARGIAGGWVATSAKTGRGLPELLARVRARISWDEMPATTTTGTFKRIKDFVLSLKERLEGGEVLTDAVGLRRRLEALDPEWRFGDDELLTAVEHLAKHGYVQLLRTASGERTILLAPELLNNLAASLVLEARRNPKGLGALDERRLLAGEVELPELAGLDRRDRATLLDAAAVLFLEHNLCFREVLGTTAFLVFPELINLKKPHGAEELALVEDASYTVAGPVDNVWAALVVLLGYTNAFTRTDQWQKQAQYELGAGEVCGFRLTDERAGEIDLVLCYGARARPSTRLLFQGLVEEFLSRRQVTVTRYPPLACPGCGYRQERSEVIRRTREGRGFIRCSECGARMELPTAGETVAARPELRPLVDREQAVADLRTALEKAVVQVLAFVRQSGREAAPSCFVSYAWGVPEHERWVERKLASDLRKAGVEVVLDRWDNAEIGASVARFVGRIERAETVVAVGTPLYRRKYENEVAPKGSIVAAEVDLINLRLVGTERQKRTVLPVLLDGAEEEALPPLMRGRVYADFRHPERYFATFFDLILTLYGIPFGDPAVADLREALRPALRSHRTI